MNKLPEQFNKAAQACYGGAVNRQLIARNIHEAIQYCHDNNVALEPDDCPAEIRIMLAQLVYILGMGDLSMTDNYHDALKDLGFTH